MAERFFRNESKEDYLEAVLVIEQAKGLVRSVDIAEHLKIKKPSVSAAIRSLESQGLLRINSDKTLRLTKEGKTLAEDVYEKHRFFKKLLLSVGVSEATAEIEACALEHDISSESFAKLKTHSAKMHMNQSMKTQ